jgi:VWFA-related protein
MTGDRLAVVALAGWFAIGLPGPLRDEVVQQTAFRAVVHTVPVYVTVQDDDGHLVPDLTQDDFQILDEGEPVDVIFFSNGIVPITVAMLLDMSGSMSADFHLVRRSTAQFFLTLLPGDRVRLGTFGQEVALSPHLTGDFVLLNRVLEQEVWPGGGTPLWTAMREGMRSLAAEPGRRVVISLTDGLDSCTFGGGFCADAREVERQALDAGFMTYAVGMSGRRLDGRVRRLAERTGGGYFELDDNADLAAAFARIADELHHQYMLAFTPHELDGRTHQLEVRLGRRGLRARARESYLAVSGGHP